MNKTWTRITLCAALHGALAPALAAVSCAGHSPAHTVALVELYTSEGCDSCPPADQYLSGLRAAGITPEKAVPLSLHVDYWNYIGWKDPFSRAVFAERQRDLSALAGSRTIYTPEVFVAGHEQRGGVQGWSRTLPALIGQINARPAQAEISIALGPRSGGGLPLEVKASAPAGATLHVALVESGLASQVTAGENSGHLLRHDFVVREWLAPVPLAPDARGGRGAASVARVLALPSGAQPEQLGVTAFVQSERGELLQAFNLPLCGNL